MCARKLMWMCLKGVKGRLGSFGLFSLAHLPGEAATEQEGLKVNYISCPSQNKCQPPDGRCNTSSPLACLSAGTSPALDIRAPMTWIKIYAKHLRTSRFAYACLRQIGRAYFRDYSWRPFVGWNPFCERPRSSQHSVFLSTSVLISQLLSPSTMLATPPQLCSLRILIPKHCSRSFSLLNHS